MTEGAAGRKGQGAKGKVLSTCISFDSSSPLICHHIQLRMENKEKEPASKFSCSNPSAPLETLPKLSVVVVVHSIGGVKL
mmetsp:Transcript_50000/g.82292  ORF Transcript_50000/g.82292 Transcript_50000/m.82292 type:complete len:80 (-) Transcript_50000:725-964(-)